MESEEAEEPPFLEEPEEKEEPPEPKTRKVEAKGEGKGGPKGKATASRWATGTPAQVRKPLVGGIFGGGLPTKASTAKAEERSLDLAMGADA